MIDRYDFYAILEAEEKKDGNYVLYEDYEEAQRQIVNVHRIGQALDVECGTLRDLLKEAREWITPVDLRERIDEAVGEEE